MKGLEELKPDNTMLTEKDKFKQTQIM